jgi:hypothetical protein
MNRGISNSVEFGRGMMSAVLKNVLLLLAFAAAASKDLNSQSTVATQVQPVAPSSTTRNAQDFAGDDACRSCHREQVETYHHTAHFLTSRPADGSTILGKFTPGNNILKTANPALFFRMDEHKPDAKGKSSTGREPGFFQTAVEGTPPHTTSHTERFALVVGSGGKGQTYLFWKSDQLFQLPVSYWTNLGWVNSPGYRDGFVNFDRPIIPRCLECHATYFEALPPPSNRYATTGFALGIQCEKCHGPGREHIAREASQEKSKAVSASEAAILNPARFSRDRQMDLCAWCHAGHGQALVPSFSYVPGDSLERFIDLPRPDPEAALDVHGSQVEMLKRSRCYSGSTMTCLTCHNVHTQQHDLAEFSRRCLDCHKPDSSTFSKPDHHVSANCIDCHMPKQETGLIVFEWNGKRVRPQVRNHWIKVYSENDTPLESR